MRKRFDDYFYDNYLEIKRNGNKPYVNIIAEDEDEMVQVVLHKDEMSDLIEFLQLVYKDM